LDCSQAEAGHESRALAEEKDSLAQQLNLAKTKVDKLQHHITHLETKMKNESQQYSTALTLSRAEYDQSIAMLIRDKDSFKNRLIIVEQERNELVAERTAMMEKHVGPLFTSWSD
jgi:flagellar hook-basal body complex protein FliE